MNNPTPNKNIDISKNNPSCFTILPSIEKRNSLFLLFAKKYAIAGINAILNAELPTIVAKPAENPSMSL